MQKKFFALVLIVFTMSMQAQQVVSGPTPTYSESTKVGIWVQCDASAMLDLTYWPKHCLQRRTRDIQVDLI
jgi:hypothetical protein